MASIRIIKKHYYLDYYDDSGKRHRRALKLGVSRENKVLAIQELKKLEYELSSGIYLEKMRRQQNKVRMLEESFEEFKLSRKNANENTIANYQLAFDKLKNHFGNIPIRKISADDILKFQEKLLNAPAATISADKRRVKRKLSKNSVASYFKQLKVIFSYFKQQGWIEKNPIPSMQLKITEPLVIERKDLEEILAVYEKKEDRTHYRILALLLLTGMRISELLRLSFDDIDFRENIMIIRNSKGKRDDKFPLYKELREFLLKEFPKREGRLFNYKSRDSLKFFYKYLQETSYPKYNFHSLRKTFISKLVNSGLSIYDVMTLARHRSIKTTLQHYTNAEVSRMGNEITERANLGTLLGTRNKKVLKRAV
jgi:integrase/recombinase XerD